MKKISVCVPTYNRPDTLKQLISSFLKQNYQNKELVISDDTPNDSIKKLVALYPKSSIRYTHNKKSLGFAFNLLNAIKMAKGEYIVILGDDDVFLSKESLSRYAAIFNKHSNVSYIYTNAVQFSEKLKIEYKYKHFDKNTIYKHGNEAMRGIWLSSLFIGGMGLRNNINFDSLYPKRNILYPQVELLGHILNKYDAYANASLLVAARSHDDQIIFKALSDKQTRGQGEHTNIEFLNIFDHLKKKYKFSTSSDFLEDYLISHHSKMIFKEKAIIGIKLAQQNYRLFIQRSEKARLSICLRLAYVLALVMPNWLIWTIKSLMLKMTYLFNRREYNTYQRKLDFMIK